MVLTNVYGAALTIRAALPALKESKGHLLLTGSVAGRRAIPGSLYSATKHAVHAMGESARQELDGTGVRVTVIAPGMTDTPFFDADPARCAARVRRHRPRRPLRALAAAARRRQRDPRPADRAAALAAVRVSQRCSPRRTPRAAARAGHSRLRRPEAGMPSRGRTDGRAARSPPLRHPARWRRRRPPPARAVRRSGIEPEAAVVEALERLAAADRGEPRPRDRRHEPHLADQAAGEAADDGIGGVRVALLVRRVRDTGPAARELDERMLEPAAGAEKRRPRCEAVADRRERGLGIAVWRAGKQPDAARIAE